MIAENVLTKTNYNNDSYNIIMVTVYNIYTVITLALIDCNDVDKICVPILMLNDSSGIITNNKCIQQISNSRTCAQFYEFLYKIISRF